MIRNKIFTCKCCKQKIQRIAYPVGINPDLNVCTICHWINTNSRLSDKEREELRRKLCK